MEPSPAAPSIANDIVLVITSLGALLTILTGVVTSITLLLRTRADVRKVATTMEAIIPVLTNTAEVTNKTHELVNSAQASIIRLEKASSLEEGIAQGKADQKVVQVEAGIAQEAANAQAIALAESTAKQISDAVHAALLEAKSQEATLPPVSGT